VYRNGRYLYPGQPRGTGSAFHTCIVCELCDLEFGLRTFKTYTTFLGTVSHFGISTDSRVSKSDQSDSPPRSLSPHQWVSTTASREPMDKNIPLRHWPLGFLASSLPFLFLSFAVPWWRQNLSEGPQERKKDTMRSSARCGGSTVLQDTARPFGEGYEVPGNSGGPPAIRKSSRILPQCYAILKRRLAHRSCWTFIIVLLSNLLFSLLVSRLCGASIPGNTY